MRDQIEKVLRRVHDLPTLPSVYRRVSDLLRNPYTSASDVAAVVGEDQVITTKLLRLVNSAHYGFPEKVETVTRAVSLVGMQAVRDLVLATSVMDLFHHYELENWTVAEFWRHSLGVAVASRCVAHATEHEHLEEFFVAGLIHDIGKIVWMQHFQAELYEVLHQARTQRIPMVEAENARLSFNHARAGRLLAKRWGLPERLIEVIAWHHDPRLADHHAPFVAVVHVADSLVNALRLGDSGNGVVPPIRPDAWAMSGLKVEQIEELVERLMAEYEDSLLLLSFYDQEERQEVEESLQER